MQYNLDFISLKKKHPYSWLPKEHGDMLINFLENVYRNTLICQQHGHEFFHKYQDWKKGKRWKKGKYVNFPLEYVMSQVYLLFALLKYNHVYFFSLKWSLLHLNVTITNRVKSEFAYRHAYSEATCLLFFCRFAQQHSLIRPTLSFGSQE